MHSFVHWHAWLNLAIGLVLGLNLLALGSSRLPSLIRAVAAQGVVLGILPLLLEQHTGWTIVLLSAGTIAAKGLVIPALLRRALVRARIDRELDPVIGFVPSLLLGAAATIGAVIAVPALPLLPEHSRTLLAPAAFATAIHGFLLLAARTKAVSQVCGYLILENGIFLLGLMLLGAMPLLVEAGILLDVTVAVFIIGIIVDRIRSSFDSLDTRKLTTLHE
jgi:hydrogenase-4 component E